MNIPQNLQRLFWSEDATRLDTVKDKIHIIHHILLYGSFDEIRWLFSVYSKEDIVKTFILYPRKLYPKETFSFVKKFILDLKHKSLDEQNYVTSISGPLRQRTAGSFPQA